MPRNYQRDLDGLLTTLAGRPKPRLLLHSCCGPCSSYVLEYLLNWFDISIFYYNPNIQPREEFEKRLETQRRLVNAMRGKGTLKLLGEDWRGTEFEEAARGLESEPEGGARCTACFKLRTRETACRARRDGFDFFCTTLTVSPHKDAERINAIGEEAAAEYGVKWLPSDFKKRGGYQRSVELAKEHGLYRQDYCGCLYSRR